MAMLVYQRVHSLELEFVRFRGVFFSLGESRESDSPKLDPPGFFREEVDPAARSKGFSGWR